MENRVASTAEEKGPELIRIEQLEKLPPDFIPTRGADNQLIVKAGKILRTARTDDRHILRAPWKEACLDIHVSKESLPRALRIMGNLIGLLEMERLAVTLDSAKSESTLVAAFGEQIQFGLIEKVRRFELPAAPQRSTQHGRTLTFAGFESHSSTNSSTKTKSATAKEGSMVHSKVHNSDVQDCLATPQDAVRALVSRCKYL